MKLEVSKRDAYIMAETLWEAAMDLDIAAKGNREQARICARIGDPVAYAPKLARLEREITRMERAARRRRAVRERLLQAIEAAKPAEQMEATTDERK